LRGEAGGEAPDGSPGVRASVEPTVRVLEPLSAHDPAGVGPYRLVGRLGTGGMGTVFAGLGRSGGRAAVKMIHPELAADRDSAPGLPVRSRYCGG